MKSNKKHKKIIRVIFSRVYDYSMDDLSGKTNKNKEATAIKIAAHDFEKDLMNLLEEDFNHKIIIYKL